MPADKLPGGKNVKVELEDGIAWVTLNRPEKRNCMSPALNDEMVEVLDALEINDACQVLVLTGAGEAFSAGMDLREFFRATDFESFDRGFQAVRTKLDKIGRERKERLPDKQLFVGFALMAAALLEGEHDFSAFRAAECQAKSPVRRLERLTVSRQGEWLIIEATANAFLHHMVRNIAGLLIAIGKGDRPAHWATEVLAGRDRRRSAPTAPAAGLYLWSVRYPEAFALPQPLQLSASSAAGVGSAFGATTPPASSVGSSGGPPSRRSRSR